MQCCCLKKQVTFTKKHVVNFQVFVDDHLLLPANNAMLPITNNLPSFRDALQWMIGSRKRKPFRCHKILRCIVFSFAGKPDVVIGTYLRC